MKYEISNILSKAVDRSIDWRFLWVVFGIIIFFGTVSEIKEYFTYKKILKLYVDKRYEEYFVLSQNLLEKTKNKKYINNIILLKALIFLDTKSIEYALKELNSIKRNEIFILKYYWKAIISYYFEEVKEAKINYDELKKSKIEKMYKANGGYRKVYDNCIRNLDLINKFYEGKGKEIREEFIDLKSKSNYDITRDLYSRIIDSIDDNRIIEESVE